MKRLFTLLFLFAAILQMTAQTSHITRRPLWVGLDMGGTWQSSDMKAQAGIGWSFTMSRYSRLDKTGPLYFGWRFRFLDGRSYGYNYHRLYGIQNDNALNNGLTNYATPTANNDGYVFSNYRFRYDEFAYELIVGSNGLRKHGVLLYAFGGAGLNHSRTTTNQLGMLDEQYDYSGVNVDGNDDIVQGQLESIWKNGNYETNANGSTSRGQWAFMPSAGVGFGYQFSDAVALGFEHRTTWALNDNIDGVNHNSAGQKTPNDLYHYDGFFVRWTFGGGHSTTTTNNTPPPNNPNNVNNNNPTYTNPNNTTTNTNTNTNTNNNTTNNTSNNTVVYPPTVRFTTPSVNPYNASSPSQQLVVAIEHINFSSQISLTINNQVNTNFSFNPNTNTMVFNHSLLPGNNVYVVTATNNYGTATDNQTIIYKDGQINTNNPLPPSVIINNPQSDPYTSLTATTNVSATVLNVTSTTGILVRKNGNTITGWSFDPNSHLVTFVANLSTGSNLYEVIGTNAVGSASDAVTINYNPTPTILPPVVTITNPNACPFSAKIAAMTISANITNVTASNQVSILFNNQNVSQFTFVNNGTFATVTFNVTLVAGPNPFTITGTNTAGTNSKSCVVTLKTTDSTPVVPPVVTITAPSTSPYTCANSYYTVNATVLNVSSQSEITVMQNNALVTNWTYSMTTHVLSLPSALVFGNNIFTVTAANINGSDSKSTTIIYNAPPTPPTVTITSPSTSPYSVQNPTYTVLATVLNVGSSTEITVKQNNITVTNWTYSMSSHILSLPATLYTGSNVFTVSALNHQGSDSKSTTIIYSAPIPVPPVVNITVPVADPFITSTPNQTIQAEVLYISQSSQITVTQFMGGAIPFTFNATTHIVTFNVVLSQPSTQFIVSATNNAGTASDHNTMKLVESQGGNTTTPPNTSGDTPKLDNNSNTQNPATRVSLTLGNPSAESSTTTQSSIPVSITATGVNNISEISVTINSVQLINFSYNATTRIISFTAPLNSGANTIVVSASNANGSSTKTLTITSNASRSSSSQSSSGREGSSSSGNTTTTPKKEDPKPKTETTTTTTTTPTKETPKPEVKPEPKTTTTKTTTTTSSSRPTTTTSSTTAPSTTVKPR